MSQASFDASIPVLTEVFQPEPANPPAPAAAAANAGAPAAEPAVLASAAPDPAPPAAARAAQQAIAAAAPAVPSAVQPAAGTVHAETAALASLDDQGWAMLEQRLAERVVHTLQSRVDFVLEQRVRDCMADVLNHAVRALTDELRSGLQDTIEQIVARAVSQELVHLQAQKKP